MFSNKIIFSFCFIFIIILHYFGLTSFYQKRVHKEETKVPYQKISIRLTHLSSPKKIKKIVQKNTKSVKKVQKKKILKKKVLTKTTKRVIVKEKIKETKKIVKKEIKLKKKELELIKKLPNKVTSTSNKQIVKSLKKFKTFKVNYFSKLRTAIDKNKTYPKISKRFEEEGLVTLSFIVLKSGLFKDIKLLTSSGSKRLDKAALKALRQTFKFLPFPKNINKPSIHFTLPMQFKLN